MINKNFIIDSSSEDIFCSLIIQGGNQIIIIDKSNYIKIVDITSRLVVSKIPLNGSDSLYDLKSRGNYSFEVIAQTNNGLISKTFELFINEEFKEESKNVLKNVLSAEEELELEKFLMNTTEGNIEDNDVNNMYLNEIEHVSEPHDMKKRWQCQTTLSALEKTAPRPNSILVSANIQIKEKSIYDIDTKKISKIRKDPGKNLSVSKFND